MKVNMAISVKAVKLVLFNRLIFILSLLGVVVAGYVLQGWLRQSPLVCLTGSGCETVAKSPYNYPFGIPVPAVGFLGYSILTVLAFSRTTSADKRLLYGILGMATFGVLFVSWFTYLELFVIRGVCSWCAISAVNMLIIFVLTIKSYLLLPK
ncbi:MAG: vitamin K epoxide reductase family protein [Patescibacteria group bacterium]